MAYDAGAIEKAVRGAAALGENGRKWPLGSKPSSGFPRCYLEAPVSDRPACLRKQKQPITWFGNQ